MPDEREAFEREALQLADQLLDLFERSIASDPDWENSEGYIEARKSIKTVLARAFQRPKQNLVDSRDYDDLAASIDRCVQEAVETERGEILQSIQQRSVTAHMSDDIRLSDGLALAEECVRQRGSTLNSDTIREHTCKWWRENNDEYEVWRTSCEQMWQFSTGGPRENNIEFCPFCGHKIQQEEEKNE